MRTRTSEPADDPLARGKLVLVGGCLLQLRQHGGGQRHTLDRRPFAGLHRLDETVDPTRASATPARPAKPLAKLKASRNPPPRVAGADDSAKWSKYANTVGSLTDQGTESSVRAHRS